MVRALPYASEFADMLQTHEFMCEAAWTSPQCLLLSFQFLVGQGKVSGDEPEAATVVKFWSGVRQHTSVCWATSLLGVTTAIVRGLLNMKGWPAIFAGLVWWSPPHLRLAKGPQQSCPSQEIATWPETEA